MAGQALAEEAAVVPEPSGLFGLQVPELVLLLTPAIGYAVFKLVIVPKVCCSYSNFKTELACSNSHMQWNDMHAPYSRNQYRNTHGY